MNEQELITFEVAKAIKEAGFPQNFTNIYYTIDGVLFDWNSIETWNNKYYNKISCPTYLDVWLWLWREKGIKISHRIGVNIIGIEDNDVIEDLFDDPEKAIIASIEYLVKHNLIK